MYRRFCASPLGNLHVFEAGDRGGATVVLLHQTPRSTDEFAEVIPLLARDYHVVAIDTIGYGCSDRVEGQPGVTDYAHGVLAVLDALGVSRAVLVGHHTGVFIALETAAIAPDRVTSLVLSGPVFMDDETRSALRPWFVQWHPTTDGAHLLDKWTRLGRWVADPSLRQRLLRDVFRAGETSEQGHVAILDYDMKARLPLVRARSLLLYATDDPFVKPADAERFRAAMAAPVDVKQIDGGIFVPTERPQLFAAAVRDFLSS
jgi:pimeloyl-ACP methyl ester carboxylesterase